MAYPGASVIYPCAIIPLVIAFRVFVANMPIIGFIAVMLAVTGRHGDVFAALFFHALEGFNYSLAMHCQ
jgi:hypothetical protein